MARTKDQHLVREPMGRWWQMMENGRRVDDRRFLRNTLIDTESCTHTMGLPGCRCPFCGGTVPADG